MATPAYGTPAGFNPPPNANSSASDIEGVGHLKIGSGLGFVVQALFWTGFAIFYLIFTALQNSVSTFGSTGSTIPS